MRNYKAAVFSLCLLVVLLAATACRQQQTPPPSSNALSPPPSPASPDVVSGTQGSVRLLTYADVVDRVAPAVVTVHSARRARTPEQFPFMNDPFFRRFFGGRNPDTPRGRSGPVERGLGSGVIVAADGYILTNHHVVDGADEIKIDLIDRRSYSAKLVGSDPPSDLALLKITADKLPQLVLADSERVRVGDICLAVGNPLGIGQTVTAGIISAKGRATGLSNGSFEDFLQTDAPINQGNSGGALVSTSGELIGINSQILSPTGSNIGIGFAIPSNMAKTVMSQLTSSGKVSRGNLGVTVQPVTSEIATKLGLKQAQGVLVNSVTPGSAADKAGIRAGDVIAAINGTAIDTPNSLRNRIASTLPGTMVNFTIMRDGREQQVTAKLGEFTSESTKA